MNGRYCEDLNTNQKMQQHKISLANVKIISVKARVMAVLWGGGGR